MTLEEFVYFGIGVGIILITSKLVFAGDEA